MTQDAQNICTVTKGRTVLKAPGVQQCLQYCLKVLLSSSHSNGQTYGNLMLRLKKPEDFI